MVVREVGPAVPGGALVAGLNDGDLEARGVGGAPVAGAADGCDRVDLIERRLLASIAGLVCGGDGGGRARLGLGLSLALGLGPGGVLLDDVVAQGLFFCRHRRRCVQSLER